PWGCPPVTAGNLEVIAALPAADDAPAPHPVARAVVIPGVGRRFCAGADIAMMRDLSPATHARAPLGCLHIQGLEALSQPVIAAIDGGTPSWAPETLRLRRLGPPAPRRAGRASGRRPPTSLPRPT